jgi:hypothetical protein
MERTENETFVLTKMYKIFKCLKGECAKSMTEKDCYSH